MTKKQGVARFICISVLTVLAIFFASGCSVSPVGIYTPDPLKTKGLAKGIEILKPVTITNAQLSDQNHFLGFRGIVVNYKTFTQALVEALKMELNKNFEDSNKNVDKELQIAVTNIKIAHPAGGLSYGADIDVEVKMGHKTKQYRGSRASYASVGNVNFAPTRPLNASFHDLVKEIITDPEIQGYINN